MAGPPPSGDPHAGPSAAAQGAEDAAVDPQAPPAEALGTEGVESFRSRRRAAAREEATTAAAADTHPPQTITADYCYEPEDLCDAVVVCGDGVRLGVHRAFLLRNSRFLATLFEEFPGQREVTVSEESSALRKDFLDVIYERGLVISPDAVLGVLQLADKYEAPGLVEACRAVIESDEFRIAYRPWRPYPLGITAENLAEAAAAGLINDVAAYQSHATVAETMCIASKYGWKDVFNRCINEIKQLGVDASFAEHTVPHLGALKPSELQEVMSSMCGLVADEQRKVQEAGAQAAAQVNSAEGKAFLAAKTEKKLRANYSKLLKKYNKLVAAAEKAGVDVATVTKLPAPQQGGGPPPLIPDPFGEFLDHFI